IIVNTDADNQYSAEDIPKLIKPIVEGNADIVVGARPIETIEHFSFTKKLLQKIGSWAVRLASGTDIPDAPSGFRAISRAAAMRLNVFNKYTYTLETIIQAGQKGMSITSVPIRVNKDLRPSRLVKSIPNYIRRSTLTIVRIFMTYKPLKFFVLLGVVLFVPGFLIGLRFIYFYLTGSGGGHIQSVILSALLIAGSMLFVVLGLLADLISVNRQLLEELSWRTRKIEETISKDDDE
ncbi:MAG: glycosyltransferase family 2 protein, partial [Thermodesulfobacteriota bacterium]